MDPVAQIFAQIGAATAHGEGMGQFFLQGRQLGLQEQQVGIRRGELDLRSRIELQDSLIRRFAHEEVVRKLDEQVGNAAALSTLSKYVGNAISSGTASDPSSSKPIWDIIETNPLLLDDDRYKALMTQYTAAATVQQARKQFDSINSPEGVKQRLAILKGETDLERERMRQTGAGERVQDQREGAYERELLRATRPGTAGTQGGVTAELVNMARAKNDEADAIADFDEAGAEKLRFDAAQLLRQPSAIQQSNQIKALADKQASGAPLTPGEAEQLSRLKRPTTEVPSENLITGMPETRKVTGRYIAPLDQQNRVVSLRKNTDSLGIIEDLERNRATEFVGAKPMVENVIWNQILPQLGINKSNERQTMAKTDFVRFVQAGIRSLNQEARLSNQDATMLIEAFPNLDSVLSSPPQADAILKTLKRAVALGAVRDAKEAQRGIPPIAGKALYLEDWFRTYEQGSLTLDEAKELARHYKSPRQPVR